MAEESLTFGGYLRHAWNAFRNKDPSIGSVDPNPDLRYAIDYSPGIISTSNPDHRRFRRAGVDKTIAAAIYNRIATDAAQARFHHVRVDENGTYIEEIKSGLNNILTCEANKDQTGTAFILDLVISLLDEGVVAAIPVDTSLNPYLTGSYDILTARTGRITMWKPNRVRVEVYNDQTGIREEIWIDKDHCAIIENPFYNIMNEPNSTLRRLTRKLALMDSIDDDIGQKKLDVIVQLPYVIKNKTKQEQADERRKQLEEQLEKSKLGVGYIDGTERVIQLNRSLENNLMKEVEYLTSMLYSQLGLTAEIMNGTATEEQMMNYYKRTIDPILIAIRDEFIRKFLTKTGRSQGQSIQFYRDPFSLTPTTVIADIADKFTRNEILSPNELRGIVGFKPSLDSAADELRNRNISQAAGMETEPAMVGAGEMEEYGEMPEDYDEEESYYDEEENPVEDEEVVERIREVMSMRISK